MPDNKQRVCLSNEKLSFFDIPGIDEVILFCGEYICIPL
ncbi:hypothetical protein F442_14320 [Phytophthora nicotianae P10297]|uniref:Uncharacterized protein n=1 Tax=Phytophthora nicotianae P10297 TaxID=1317064 RepID=W2YSJ0_PHYNI|nr:hypothetical protein F442_14320 [Phytophthora nicotianae P10297]